jgi:hypothetical protein
MKYLQAFLAEAEPPKNIGGIVPAKPAKVSFDGFDGFAGSSRMGFSAKERVSQGSLIVANGTDEVERIVVAWRDLLGLKLDREKVGNHLAALRRWQRGAQRA